MFKAIRRLATPLSWIIFLLQWLAVITLAIGGVVTTIILQFEPSAAMAILGSLHLIDEASLGHYEFLGLPCHFSIPFCAAIAIALIRPRKPVPAPEPYPVEAESHTFSDLADPHPEALDWDRLANLPATTSPHPTRGYEIRGYTQDMPEAAAGAVTNAAADAPTVGTPRRAAPITPRYVVPPGYHRGAGFNSCFDPQAELAMILADVRRPSPSPTTTSPVVPRYFTPATAAPSYPGDATIPVQAQSWPPFDEDLDWPPSRRPAQQAAAWPQDEFTRR